MAAADPLAELDFEPAPMRCECPPTHSFHHGGPCPNDATWHTEVHEINGCTKPDLKDGAGVRLLCDGCYVGHLQRVETLTGLAQRQADVTGEPPTCQGCGRRLLEPDDIWTTWRIDARLP